MYIFNVVFRILDELLELKEYVKHESEASQAWILFPNVAKFGMFFHVMQTIHFIHVCVR